MAFIRIVLAMGIVLLLSTNITVAQPLASSFESSLTGAVIDIGDSGEAAFIPDWHDVYSAGGYMQEDVYIARGSSTFAVYFVEGDITPAIWEDDSLASLVPTYIRYDTLDEEIGAETSWSLYRGTYLLDYSEVGYGEFVLNAGDSYHISVFVIAHESVILDDIAWIQSELTIDGASIFANTDTERIEEGITESGPFGPRQITAFETTNADWKDHGLESSSVWTSPQTGIQLSWDNDAWELQYNRSNAIVIDSDYPRDSIRLIAPDASGQLLIYVSENEALETVSEWTAWWGSSAYLADHAAAGNQVSILSTATSDNTGSVILEITDKYGEHYYAIFDIFIDENGRAIHTQLFADADNLADAYASFWDGVKADGEFYPLTWTLEEIEALSGE